MIKPALLSTILSSIIVTTGLAQSDTGYFKTAVTIPRDSITAIRKKILDLPNNTFTPHSSTGRNNITIQYRQLDPLQQKKGRKYPLVVVLHGSNAVGTNNSEQLGILAKFWAQQSIREHYPAYVIAPQFPVRSSNYSHDAQLNTETSVPDPCLSTALQLIDSLKRTLSIDPKRIYIMGMSMGGSGVINSIELRPDLFAAGINISGVAAFNNLNKLKQVPLWITHGNADEENPFQSDWILYQKLKALKTPGLRFWEVDGLKHETFYKLYATEDIPQWLFKHRKRK